MESILYSNYAVLLFKGFDVDCNSFVELTPLNESTYPQLAAQKTHIVKLSGVERAFCHLHQSRELQHKAMSAILELQRVNRFARRE